MQSNSLKDDEAATDLSAKLKTSVATFEKEAASIMHQMALREIKQAEVTRNKDFLTGLHDLLEMHVYHATHNEQLGKTEKDDQTLAGMLLVQHVTTNLADNYFHSYLQITREKITLDALHCATTNREADEGLLTPTLTTDEQKIRHSMFSKFKNFFVPVTTLELQTTLQAKTDSKKHNSNVTAKWKTKQKKETTAATAEALSRETMVNAETMNKLIDKRVQSQIPHAIKKHQRQRDKSQQKKLQAVQKSLRPSPKHPMGKMQTH